MPLALNALAVATFAIGTTEFVVVGLLPGITAERVDSSRRSPRQPLRPVGHAGTPIFLSRNPQRKLFVKTVRRCIGRGPL
jgi:hypothetical protein